MGMDVPVVRLQIGLPYKMEIHTTIEQEWMCEGIFLKSNESIRIKCKKPLAHRPEFEGKYHCKACEREMNGE